MALLTDIVASSGGAGGVQLGDYLYARPEHFGMSGNIGSQQFVRTGFLVPFESRHAPLIALSKQFGVLTSNVSLNNNWIGGTATNWANIRHANGRYYRIELPQVQSTWGSPSQNVRYGNSYTVNATAGIASAFAAPGTTVGIGDNVEFNNGINVIGYTGGNPHGMDIYRLDAGGTSFSRVYNNGTIHGGAYGAALANSSSNIAAWPGGFLSSGSNDMASSNDGVVWTARGATVNGAAWSYDSGQISLTRCLFSTVANAYFILSTNNSVIYTSNNGYQLIARASPPGYGSVPWNGSQPASSAYGFYANSPTVTIVPIGSGKMLRITSLTDYQVVDVGKGGYSSAMFCVVWDGTQFIAFPYVNGGLAWVVPFTSTDGLTWTTSYTFAGVYAPNSTYVPPVGLPAINQLVYTVGTANSRIFVQTTGVLDAPIFDVTGRFSATSPDYVGVPVALTFASGSSLVPYLRVS